MADTLKCKECNEMFEVEEDALAHVKEQHADVCDEKLQEYIPDSIEDAFADLIEDI